MAANKRTSDEILFDRDRISGMYLKGYSQRQIRDAVNEGRPVQKHITQQQVSEDLKVIRGEWRASAVRNFDEAKEEELQKLNRMEHEAWMAWERSQKDATVTSAEKSENEDGTRSKTRIQREEQVGDPRFLQTAMQCVDRRCKILGLDAPVKQAFTDVNGQDREVGYTMEDIVRMTQEVRNADVEEPVPPVEAASCRGANE